MPEPNTPPVVPPEVEVPAAAPPERTPWPILHGSSLAGTFDINPRHKFAQGVAQQVTTFMKSHPWSRELTEEQRFEKLQALVDQLSADYHIVSPKLVQETEGYVPLSAGENNAFGGGEYTDKNAAGEPLERPEIHLTKFSVMTALFMFRRHYYALQNAKATAEAATAPVADINAGEETDEVPPENLGAQQYLESASWAYSLFYRAAPRRFIRQAHKGALAFVSPDEVIALLPRTGHVTGASTCPGCRRAQEMAARQAAIAAGQEPNMEYHPSDYEYEGGSDMFM